VKGGAAMETNGRICKECGEAMIEDKSPGLSIELGKDMPDIPEIPKKQIQRTFYCNNPDCIKYKEPIFILESLG